MATAREHLKKMHKTMAEFHKTMSACHSTALSKETMDTHQRAFHKEAGAAHDAAANAHNEMCEECAKSTDAVDLNKLVPSAVSGIAPPAPARPGIAMIPRAGQPPLPAAAPMPQEFEKLFSVEDGPQMRQAPPTP